MHTHDLENHDNLYAEEVPMHGTESALSARSHASRAVLALVVMVGVLAGIAALTSGWPMG
jgi:hypothetical protein